MTRVLFINIIFFLAMTSGAANAANSSRVECGSVKSMYAHANVGYCALLPAAYDQQKSKVFPVLYLLHGLGDNHETLINTGIWNMVEALQRENRIGDFVIITPDGDRTFYVNSKDERVRYEDFFIREFIPAMEHKFRIGETRNTRAISGISMGGYGALRFAFKYPQLFSSVSAHSAALIEQMPRGAEAAGLGMIMGRAFGSPFDPDYWKRNTPFVFAKNGNLNRMKIYFDCGDHDDYGFEVGAEALHRELISRKIPHEFHIYPGNHNWLYFAEHLPASFEFHSRNFGLAK